MQMIPADAELELAAGDTRKNFIDTFRSYYKLGVMYANSSLVPEQYKNRPADCTIAIDIAERMGVPVLMVMQSLYIVKGKPSWSGQACMTFIKNKFKDARPVYIGKRGTGKRGCYIRAITKNDEEICGTEVTMEMAAAEGWLKNPKWKSMPEQMLAYRAAAFFARIYCPECLMGVYVEGEPEDIAANKK